MKQLNLVFFCIFYHHVFYISILFFPCHGKAHIYSCHGFSSINLEISSCFMEHQHFMEKNPVDCFVCLPSTLQFICWTRSVIFFFLFHWSLPVIIHLSGMVEILTLYCFCWLFECPVRELRFTEQVHYYNRLLNMGMIWFQNITSLLLTKNYL